MCYRCATGATGCATDVIYRMCQSHSPPLVFFSFFLSFFFFFFFFFELRDFHAAHRSEGARRCVLLRHEFKVDLIRHALQPAGGEMVVWVCVSGSVCVCVCECVRVEVTRWVGVGVRACVGE